MSDKNTDKELSMDELKDVAGGGMGLDRLGTQKVKGVGPTDDVVEVKATLPIHTSSNPNCFEDKPSGSFDGDVNDVCMGPFKK